MGAICKELETSTYSPLGHAAIERPIHVILIHGANYGVDGAALMFRGVCVE